MVLRWAKKNSRGPVEFFFEDGATHRGQLEKLIREENGFRPNFRSKQEMVQFQAADLLAWKNRKVLTGAAGYGGPGDADLYASLMRSMAEIRSIPHKYGVHDDASLEKVCVAGKVPRR